MFYNFLSFLFCFNEAATERSRKVASRQSHIACSQRFNEAATERSRKAFMFKFFTRNLEASMRPRPNGRGRAGQHSLLLLGQLGLQ